MAGVSFQMLGVACVTLVFLQSVCWGTPRWEHWYYTSNVRKDENTSHLCLLLLLFRGSFIAASSLSLTKCIVLNLFSVNTFLSVSWPVRMVLARQAHGAVEQLLGCPCLCWVTGSPYTTFVLPLVHALTGAGYSYPAGIFLFATWTLRVNSDCLLASDPSGK